MLLIKNFVSKAFSSFLSFLSFPWSVGKGLGKSFLLANCNVGSGHALHLLIFFILNIYRRNCFLVVMG